MKIRTEATVALVTGGTDGIGKQTALRLAQRGVHLILVGRNASKGDAFAAELRTVVPSCTVQFIQADLALMQDVQRLADNVRAQHDRLDMLVHCAGVMLRKRILTAEGLETVFAVQYLARMLLTNVLLDRLTAAVDPRVVDVSAGGMFNFPLNFDNLQGEQRYSGVSALLQESIANDMLVLELAARHADVRFFNYGPYYVRTTLLRDMSPLLRIFAATGGRLISITPQRAADDILTLLTGDYASGLYGRKAKRSRVSRYKANPANRERLWHVSETLIAGALRA